MFIYSYGGGRALYEVFNAIASIFNDNGYRSLLIALSYLLGYWFLQFNYAKNHELSDQPKWVIYFYFVYGLLLFSPVTVYIKDEVNNERYHVDNVPLLIQFPATIISEFGHAVTVSFDQAFKAVNASQYNEHGLAFATKIKSKLSQAEVVDDIVNENLERYIRRCVGHQLNKPNRYTLRDLRESNDIWQLLTSHHSTIMHVLYYDVDTESSVPEMRRMTCKAAIQRLDEDWNKVKHKDMMYFFKKFSNIFTVGVEHRDIKRHTFINNKINAAFADLKVLKNIGNNAESILRQQIMINTIPRAFGSGLNTVSFAADRASFTSLNQKKITGQMAGGDLAILHSVISAIIIGCLPIIAFLMLMPNGFNYIKQFCMICLWKEMWAPLYSILNMLVELYSNVQSNYILSDGLTMLNASAFASVNEQIAAYAGYCEYLIPFLAIALVKGLSSFVHLSGSMTGPAMSAAATAGNEITSGSFSGGNLDFNNHRFDNNSSFKHDSAISYNNGSINATMASGASYTVNPDGNTVFRAGGGYNESTANMNIGMNEAITASFEDRVASEESLLQAQSKEYSEAETSNIHATSDFISAYANSKQSGTAWNVDQSTSEGKALNKIQEIAKSVQDRTGTNDQTSIGIATELTTKDTPIGKILSQFGMSGGLSADKKKMWENFAADVRDDITKEGISFNQEDMYRLAKQQNFNDHNSEEYRSTESVVNSYEKMQQSRTSMSATKQNIDNISHAINQVRSGGLNINREYGHEFQNWLAEQPMGSGTIGQIGAFKIINHEPQRAQDYAHIFSKQIAGDLLHRVNNTPSNATMNNQFNNIDYSSKIDKQGLDVAPNTIENLRADHNVGKDKLDHQIREQADQQMHEQREHINNKNREHSAENKQAIKNKEKELEDVD